MTPLLVGLTTFGLVAVGLCFFFLMPLCAKTLLFLTGVLATELGLSKAEKRKPHTTFINPNDLEELKGL